MTEATSTTHQVCPRCGTKVAQGASRCVVCGAELRPGGARGRRPSAGGITLSLPLAIGILVVFVLLSAGATFLGVRLTGGASAQAPATITPTPSMTSSPTVSPQPSPTFTPVPTPTPITHVVGQNDTCLQIAAFYSVSIQSIIELNQLPISCPLSVGQKILIPQPTATASPQPSPTLLPADATKAACQTVDYEVQANDTLFGIASNYNVDMQDIRDWNGLTGDTVFEGQKLSIPLCHRAANSGPTPTPTVPPPYPAPNLLLPQDGQAFSLADDSVTLQWASVGELRENEFYQVHVIDLTDGTGTRVIIDTVQDTKYLVPASLRPGEPRPHIMRWWVETVRQTGSNSNGDPVYESAGAASDQRVFSWSGSAAGATPTP
jgi:LysM repeat protein